MTIKENDILYMTTNPNITPCGYTEFKVVKENDRLIAVAKDNKNYKLDIEKWRPRLKKSIKELGSFLTIDAIECSCCGRPYN